MSEEPVAKKLKLDEASYILEQDSNIIHITTQELETDCEIQSSLPRYLTSVFGFDDTDKNQADASHDLSIRSHDILSTNHTPPLFDSPEKKQNKLTASCHGDERKVSAPHLEPQISIQSSSIMKGETLYYPPPKCICLNECTKVNKLVSVLVLVIQVNPIVEVVIKKGYQIGKTVAMASLLVADPTCPQFKLTLWRETSEWSERLSAGDIILLSNVCLKKWNKEIVGHTTLSSRLLNLHQPKNVPTKIQDKLPEQCFKIFLNWAKCDHFYLFQRSKTEHKVYFMSSHNFCADITIHFRGKLINFICDKVVLFSDDIYTEILLSIVGNNAWINQLKLGVGAVWEVYYVRVLPEGTQAGCYCLQTTTRTRFECLQNDNLLAKDIHQRFTSFTDKELMGMVNVSIKELREVKRSGRYCVTAKADDLSFIMDSDDLLHLSPVIKSLINHHELLSTLTKAVYIGCSLCTRPIVQDNNGVYCLCKVCIKKSPGVSPKCSHYFRPATLILCNNDDTYIVHVPSITTTKLLFPEHCSTKLLTLLSSTSLKDESTPPEVQTMGEALYQCLQHMMSQENHWTICVDVSLDENSYIQSVKSTLLKWDYII